MKTPVASKFVSIIFENETPSVAQFFKDLPFLIILETLAIYGILEVLGTLEALEALGSLRIWLLMYLTDDNVKIQHSFGFGSSEILE